MSVVSWLRRRLSGASFEEALNDNYELIVRAYGQALAEHAQSGFAFQSASELPYPKSKIKVALITALRCTKDSKVREQLKIGLLELSNWQDDIVDGVRKISSKNELASATAEQLEAIQNNLRETVKWNEIYLVEADKMKKELMAMGLW